MSADGYVVRRMRADEWRQAKELRLAALLDPAAPVAFLETHDDAAARPDLFWQDRALGNATSDAVCGVVALDPDGRWVGTATGLVEEPGTTDFAGLPVERRQVHLVGVFVRPEHRGTGLLARMFDEVQDWARGLGVSTARLCVHVRNPRAQAAYRRYGFTPSGERFVLDAGEELEMVRPL
ncbi:GNAT family N-acetyltransferase [Isoptericola sp. NEAU-Y5]|uniref:GNAT family N-acetyltransferase n=1 Tax=Isoptericola luteus TaxID=2879484 RepID=A0ABS7ZGD4_9MICO|nr:GNAT family N-acetyltransferase [Isoptericola sp. NEAU-Y5]MCA5894090.1 GNAT family N-acetyltransferase [Isoptericola sp. NEAU-Y5]